MLTWLINVLWRGNLTDCNSGFRAFRRELFDSWAVVSTGMEFASELILSCLEHGGRIVEVPIRYKKDGRIGRTPHLKSWRDGMRHLLLILSRAPQLFWLLGSLVLAVSTAVAGISLFGPLSVGVFSVFGIHSLIISMIFGFLGAQTSALGLVLYAAKGMKNNHAPRLVVGLLSIPEDRLWWSLFFLSILALGLFIELLVSWAHNQFHRLGLLTLSLFTAFVITVVGSVLIGILHAHLMKRVLWVTAARHDGRGEPIFQATNQKDFDIGEIT